MKGFKAYDIRGVYTRDFDAGDVYRVGFFLPTLLNADRVLVGRDVRESSDEIFEALCRGITEAGADVFSMGLATTPMVYYGTAKHRFPASVQITASHNPKEYNGLKISRTGALPVGYDSGLAELEEMVNGGGEPRPAETPGSIEDIDIRGEYIEFLKGWADFSGLQYAIDCSNGMASLLVKDIFGGDPIYLYDTLDGRFPNHEPNPLIEENVKALKDRVVEKGLDLGIIFDGDADRVMFVDDRGRFVSPDLMIGILGIYLLEEEKGGVLHDIRTSRSVTEHIRSLGGTPHMWKVGHAFAKTKLREIGAVYGGELAGHYYFRDFFHCDSGMLAAIIALNVLSGMKRGDTAFSSLIDSIRTWAFSGEINFRIEKKNEAMTELYRVYGEEKSPDAVYDFDGYRIEFADWWFNVRPSNTEPYLRLVVEAKDDKLLEEKVAEIRDRLSAFE